MRSLTEVGRVGNLKTIVFSQGCSYRERLDLLLAEMGILSVAALAFGSIDAILSCVAAGIGITLLPRGLVSNAAQRNHVAVHALASDTARMETLFVRRRDAYLSNAMRAFLDVARNPCAALLCARRGLGQQCSVWPYLHRSIRGLRKDSSIVNKEAKWSQDRVRLQSREMAKASRQSCLHVETFESPKDFLAFPKYDAPSCLILDVRLRGESGLAFQQEAHRCGVRMPILFITAHGDIEMTVKAMKAGALDFFAKPFRDQDMLDAIAHALKRDAERRESEQALATLQESYETLTQREREVMKFVVAGMLNKQIAYELHLSEITVKIHRGQVMKKMVSRSLPDLVRKAEALGIDQRQPSSN
ncbi:Nodulation protein W, putative [Ricinus communis]|uniref:Nodulation protein W, putative n=1 Tax=Ricinus communis TaxID=3988 RepID=B9TDJ8_RICCO|nr:Nodulation protein W, putative [Ricinus communis]